ncbi:HNH endonuclease [Candidatus Pacearchaeota archaeon]|nr:HNH endonuclease [Candidatus Pacearchaeota archaeon]
MYFNRPCNAPGCGRLTTERYCERHKHQTRPTSSHARGYTPAWRRARLIYLAEHPLCAQCAKQGRRAAATVVDHIVPHKRNQELFWDEANWQGLCKTCHNRKTASEDGGFGR